MSAPLALNEALISVERPGELQDEPLEVFYQLKECFGCPLEKLAYLATGGSSSFRVGTRFSQQLQISQIPNATICSLDELTFNSHAHYRIQISQQQQQQQSNIIDNNTTTTSTSGHKYNCKLQTLDSGECSLCPLAVLVCILFAFLALEWLFITLIRRKNHHKLPSSDSSLADEPDTIGNTGAGDDGVAGSNEAQLGPSQSATEEASNRSHSGANRRATNSNNTTITSSSRRQRIECLDAFRGLTIAGMIFVNYGGAGFAIWQHKAWDGITLADFVFPFFIFSMGCSIAISVRSQVKLNAEQGLSFFHLAGQIFRRSLILMLLGICLNSKWLDYNQANSLAGLRLTGVLQRFGVSYLVIALMYATELTLKKWMQAQSLSRVPYLSKVSAVLLELLTAANYLSIYVYFTFLFDFNSPTCPRGYLGPGGHTEAGRWSNCTGGAAAWLDHLILGQNHLYNDHEVKEIFKTQVSHDPEGILGYTTSILLTLIGFQCGKILIKRNLNHRQRLMSLAKCTLLLALASLLVIIIPINKRLWSLTFITITALVAFLLIIVLYIQLDVYKCKRSFLLKLLMAAGKNSLFLYIGHSLINNILPLWFPIGDPTSHLQLMLRLAWYTFVWLLIAYQMDRKRIYITV